MLDTRPRLSIVSTLYKSVQHVPEFCRRAAQAAAALTPSYEIILVNDGSPDASLAVALELRAADPRIRVIDLSRNFGHHKALMTGLSRARGELVLLIDSDLEEQPEWLQPFQAEMTRTEADVVYGVQQSRKGGVIERLTGTMFFALFNQMLTHPIPANIVTARLMTRRYVEALLQHRDQEIFLAGLWMLTGFEQRPVEVVKQSRGETSYSARRRISVFVNAITSLSNRPLIYIFYLGAVMMLLSMAAAAGLAVMYLRGGIGQPGWASIMISIWFLGGLTVFCLGVIGVYLAKVFSESKPRPFTVVRAEYGTGEDRSA
jgi:putative glycosyltransferase